MSRRVIEVGGLVNRHGPRGRETAIRFLIGDEEYTVGDVEPTISVLTYLREHLRRKGSKEGCAEGDCGACMVVVVEALDGRLHFRPVNSCIYPLAMMDGKALVTVESLSAGSSGRLHPVQQAMVDNHGSQCGFCTPGFVMSLFALYKTRAAPEEDEIDYALAGNLCRCTGYRPIRQAAREMYTLGNGERRGHWLASPHRTRPDDTELAFVARLDAQVRRKREFRGDVTAFYAPADVNDLARLLLVHPEATVVAGATDVGVWLSKRQRDVRKMVSVAEVAELRNIEDEGDEVTMGAAVTVAEATPVLVDNWPGLGDVLRRFGSLPIATSATLAGNLVNASPVGDLAPALIALGATVVLRRGHAKRLVTVESFISGYRTTSLGLGEFVESVRLPKLVQGQHFRAYKVAKRYEQDTAAVNCGISIHLKGGRARGVSVCFGGMAEVPLRAKRCEAAIEGSLWNEATLERAIAALARDYQPIDDARGSAAYRSILSGNLLRRFQSDVETGT